MPLSISKDNNRIPMIMGTSSDDGTTIQAIYVNASANALKVRNGSSGTDYPFVDAQRDANRVPTIWGVSSADGVTPIPIYVDSSGNLLTQTT